MIDTNERIQDLVDTEEEFGNQEFTWKNNTYVCIPSSIKTVLTPEPGALTADRMVTITVRQNLFDSPTTFPKSQESIMFKDDKFMILQVDRDTFDVQLRLTCIAVGKGAHG